LPDKASGASFSRDYFCQTSYPIFGRQTAGHYVTVRIYRNCPSSAFYVEMTGVLENYEFIKKHAIFEKMQEVSRGRI